MNDVRWTKGRGVHIQTTHQTSGSSTPLLTWIPDVGASTRLVRGHFQTILLKKLASL